MVLLGPSGCGKSTVLRMIAGLEPITSGTVSIDGQVVNHVPAKARDIAMVFQSYALYPHMTVYDNLAFGLRRRDIEQAEIARRVHAAAGKLRIDRAAAAQAPRAFRRAAAARGGRPRDRARSQGVPVRRAAVESGRRAARQHAQRADQAAAGDRDDVDLRDPRSGRGDDDGRSHLHHERGQGGADRAPAGRVSKSRRHLRRALSRQPADEPVARADRAEGRSHRRAVGRRQYRAADAHGVGTRPIMSAAT